MAAAKTAKKNEKGIPYGAREHMPLWFPLAWSSRGVANAINVILVGYVTYYCTDMLGLSAIIVGSMLVASKIIDAFTDLGIGYIIVSVPNMSQAAQYIYVFIMYVLVNAVCVTALGGADAVYMARTFTTDGNRIMAMSVNGVVVMFCSIVFNIALPQLMNTLGAVKEGWTQIALLLCSLFSSRFWLRNSEHPRSFRPVLS